MSAAPVYGGSHHPGGWRGNVARIALALVILVAIAGCGRDVTVEERLERAREHRAEGELQAAAVELRNAAQDNPENAQVRELLGRLHLELGDTAAAAKELGRAIDLAAPRRALVEDLGAALLQEREVDRLLGEVSGEDHWPDSTRANIHGLRARAYLVRGDETRARESVQQALTLDASALQALLARVELAVHDGRLDDATRWMDRAVETHADSVAAWRLAARVALARRQPKAAESAISRAIELAAEPVEGHILRARLRVARGDLEGAREDLAAIDADYGEHPRVRLIRGLVALAQGDRKAGCGEIEASVSDAPEYAEARFFLGACHLRSGELNQAESHLEWVHERFPAPPVARLLGRIQLALDQPERARGTVRPVVRSNPDDAAATVLLAQSEFALGNTVEAVRYLEKLARMRPNDPAVRVNLGTGLLQAGETEAGMEALGEALALDPQHERAGAALVISHVRAGEYDQALEQAAEMARANPGSALPPTLTGLVHGMQGNEPAARAALEEAVELDPGNPGARHLLARHDLEAGRKKSAIAHLEKVLEHHPRNTETLLQLAALEASAGEQRKVRELLRRAHESDPTALAPRISLARYQLSRGDAAEALATISDADWTVPRDAEALELAGRAQLATNQPNRALESFARWAALEPGAQGVHLWLARAHAATGNADATVDQLETELAGNPDTVEARILLARVRVLQGRADEAREELARLPEEVRQNNAHVRETRAMMALRAGEPERAAEHYRRLMELAPSARTAVRLSRSLDLAGRGEAALEVLEAWSSEHPGHAPVHLLAGDLHLEHGRHREAIAAYRKVLEQAPDAVHALNNLAYLLRERRPDEALQLAERAIELQPDSATVRDTMGRVLLEQGSVDRAIEHFRAAVDRVPRAPDFRYHLALGLAAAGDASGAREQVRRALASDTRFAERAEAERLLQRLAGGS